MNLDQCVLKFGQQKKVIKYMLSLFSQLNHKIIYIEFEKNLGMGTPFWGIITFFINKVCENYGGKVQFYLPPPPTTVS